MGAFSLIVVINLLNRKILFLISSIMSGMGAKKQCIYPTAEQNLFKVESVKGNGLKKVLVIGYEGAGKSKLCNYLAGYESDVLFYQEGGSSGRGYLQLANIFYRGEADKPISVIKTPGLKQPNADVKTSAENMDMITGIVEELRQKTDVISSVLIVDLVNNGRPELEGILLGLLRVVKEAYQLHGYQLTLQNSMLLDNFAFIGQNTRNRRITVGSRDGKYCLTVYEFSANVKGDKMGADLFHGQPLWAEIGYNTGE